MKEYKIERRGAKDLSPEYVTSMVGVGWELHTCQYFPAEDCRDGIRVAFYHLVWEREILNDPQEVIYVHQKRRN